MYLLPMFGMEISLVSPRSLEMPKWIMDDAKARHGISPKTYGTIQDVISWTDVLYVTRIQKERFPDPNEYEMDVDVSE